MRKDTPTYLHILRDSLQRRNPDSILRINNIKI